MVIENKNEDVEDLLKLPEHWKWVKIKNIGNIETGTTPSTKIKEYYGNDYPFFKPTDLEFGKEVRNAREYLSSVGFSKTRYLPKGSTLVTCIGATIGKTGLLQVEGASNQQINAIIPFNCMIPEYVYYQIIGPRFQKEIKNNASATTLPIINKSKFTDLPFAFTNLPEQRAIVGKIEQLFSELDNGIANLKLAQEQLKVYRQAVLKQAFTGELTRKWREEQTDLPDAEELLEEIRREREQKLTSSEKKKKMNLENSHNELPDLPPNWKWTTTHEVSRVTTGVTPLTSRRDFYQEGTIPWVTSGALNEPFVKTPSNFVTDVALSETKLKIIPKKSLLIALYGEGKTRGKCSELLIDATINQAVAALIQEKSEEKIRPYLKWYLTKNYEEIRTKSSGGVQPNLNLSIIKNIEFPLCSLLEQQVIVAEIETRLSVCDRLNEDITDALEKAEALRQSILKQAFEGKLLSEQELTAVRNDPEWEPAEALLKRIKAEKTNNAFQSEHDI